MISPDISNMSERALRAERQRLLTQLSWGKSTVESGERLRAIDKLLPYFDALHDDFHVPMVRR